MEQITIGKVLDELLNDKHIPLEVVVDRYFNSRYRQRTNGHWNDRNGFLRHLHKLREIVSSAKIEVLDEIFNEVIYADRHLVHITKYDGSRVTQEVYLIGEKDEDGKFIRIEEMTLMLEGAEADHDIGSIQ